MSRMDSPKSGPKSRPTSLVSRQWMSRHPNWKVQVKSWMTGAKVKVHLQVFSDVCQVECKVIRFMTWVHTSDLICSRSLCTFYYCKHFLIVTLFRDLKFRLFYARENLLVHYQKRVLHRLKKKVTWNLANRTKPWTSVSEHNTLMNVVTDSEDQRRVRRKPAGGNRHHTPDLARVGG